MSFTLFSNKTIWCLSDESYIQEEDSITKLQKKFSKIFAFFFLLDLKSLHTHSVCFNIYSKGFITSSFKGITSLLDLYVIFSFLLFCQYLQNINFLSTSAFFFIPIRHRRVIDLNPEKYIAVLYT